MLTIDIPFQEKGPAGTIQQAQIIRDIGRKETRRRGEGVDRGVQPVRFASGKPLWRAKRKHEPHATINLGT